ncbi:hypothetical protein L596_003821 [Steinernema carpocapsae]|uniref:Polycomb protein VEFS-Box domain-containing protein n=1 Tax=Steinernema carpocapsae TaxID=34508 RepID=A0A4U8UVE3_STECR|nr:hypothetical protein L596_003821 [Steinernema carpocapsae]
MNKSEPKSQQTYKGDRLEDIFFGTSESESSEDSAYRCRANTANLKKDRVPLTRRQARTQMAKRPAPRSDPFPSKVERTFSDESSSEGTSADGSSSKKKSKQRAQSSPRSSKTQRLGPSPKKRTDSNGSIIPGRPMGDGSGVTNADPLISTMRDAILLYNYMHLPSGLSPDSARPVFRPYLKRNLRFYGKRNLPKRSLNKVLSELHDQVDPNGIEFKAPEEDDRVAEDDQAEIAPTPIPFTALFYGIRNRFLAGDRNAKVELYLAKEADGTLISLKELPSDAISMAVNKDVDTVFVSVGDIVSNSIPDVKKIDYYLVVKVKFSNDSSLSSGGRSLRKIPVRQSALHSRPDDRRLICTPVKPTDEEDDLVMYGACLITTVSKTGHTQSKVSTRSGIVLLESDKVVESKADWMADKDVVKKMIRLAKKLHTNPFILAEFVEEDLLGEDAPIANAGKAMKTDEASTTTVLKRSRDMFGTNSDMQFDFPHKIAYRFNAVSNTKCVPLCSAFKKQKLSAIDLDCNSHASTRNYQKVGLSSAVEMLLNSPKIDASTNLSDPMKSIAEPKVPGSRFSDIKDTEDFVAFGNQGVPFPQPDTSTVVTRVVEPSRRCIFCKQNFSDMFALLMHLRVGYPRLDFVYRGRVEQSLACVDVFVNEFFDNEKHTAGHIYLSKEPRKLPPSTPLFLVSRYERLEAKESKKSLEVFETTCNKDKRLHERKMPISFNPISLHPYYEVPLNTTQKKLDHDWRVENMLRRLHDFTDVTEGEKKFMGMWNMFCLNVNKRPVGKSNFYESCRRFLKKYSKDIEENDLMLEWMAHVTYFKQCGLIDADDAFDLISRCLEEDYNPEADSLHFISRDREGRRIEAEERRQKFEEAEKKRLKESNSTGASLRIDRKDLRHLMPLTSSRLAGGGASGSRDSSVMEIEERSSVESSLFGKKSRAVKEPDYSRYLRDY